MGDAFGGITPKILLQNGDKILFLEVGAGLTGALKRCMIRVL